MAREGLKLYNTLTRNISPFVPLEEGKVRMYVCGPTVYNYAHIGNFRTFVASDLLRRYLEYKGFTVEHAMNITDIDDKTIRDSQKEGKKLLDFTTYYTSAFFEDWDVLGLLRPTHTPKATDHIEGIISMVKTLLEKGIAYEEDGSVYFSIEKSPDYGELACLDKVEFKENADGRLDSDEYGKENARDFALWKAWTDDDGEVSWESPWGKGRPGWHIECSVMSTALFGTTFDIHAGGVDLKFPHHTNEIAQSQGATGEKYVNTWFHSEFLIVEGEKMSKSTGNFFTLREILEKKYSGKAIKYLLMSTHYRQRLNFTFLGLDAAEKNVEKISDFVLRLQEMNGEEQAQEEIHLAKKKFEACLDDDLNISGALGAVFDLMRDINKKNLSQESANNVLETMYAFDHLLGLDLQSVSKGEIDKEIEKLIIERNTARKEKNWARSDEIRDQLLSQGIELLDGPEGTQWRKKK